MGESMNKTVIILIITFLCLCFMCMGVSALDEINHSETETEQTYKIPVEF